MPTTTTHLPVFDQSYAHCGNCELQSQCGKGLLAYAYRPEDWNGVMVVGEGPGRQEVLAHRPFVGPAGRLLAELMLRASLKLDQCYITNATLCKPPASADEPFLEKYPNAVPSCLSRLEAEIAALRPKVIIPLGAVAWHAISGYDVQKVKHVPVNCDRCKNERKVGPVLQCAAPVLAEDGKTASPCHHLHFLRPGASMEAQAQEVELIKARGCEKCGARMKRLRPKKVPCPACGGRKTADEAYTDFQSDFSLSAAAGAVFKVADHDGKRAAHELHPWLAQHGVQYVIPTYHPSYMLRGQSFMATAVVAHFQTVKRLLEGREPVKYAHEVTSDPKRVLAWVQELKDAGIYQVAVDIETIGKPDPSTPGAFLDAREVRNVEKIQCIGFAAGTDALVVDTRTVSPADASDPMLEALFKVLTDASLSKTYHHGAGYDLLVLDLVWGFPVQHMLDSYTDDTLCAHGNLYPDEPHSLAHVATELLDVYAWKPARKVKGAEVHGSFQELAEYNARDVIHTDLARQTMGVRRGEVVRGGRLDRAGLSDVYTLDGKLRKAAVAMTMAGLPLDAEGWSQAGNTAQGHIDEALGRIQQVVGELELGKDFNPRSSADKVSLLYTDPRGFKLPIVKQTDKMNPATDGTTLAKLLLRTENPKALAFLHALRDFLDHDYVAKNFVFSAAMQPWEDGRIHPIWKPWGAKTGRWTSSPNAQNWPKWLRALVKSPAGRKLVGADYDQLELRNMALLSGDPELIRRCANADDKRKLEPDFDPHSFVASMAFGTRFTQLLLQDPAHKKDPKCRCQTCTRKALRDLTKRVIYGLNYGAGEAKVLESIYDGGYEGPPITIDMIALVKRSVFRAFSHVEPWRVEQVRLANATGELRSPLLGRRRVFPFATLQTPGLREDVPTPEIFNYPIQSMGADIVNTQMALLLDRLPAVDPTAFCIAQVHDAIYVEAAEDRAEAVAALLTETLTVEHSFGDNTMLFTAAGAVADSWKEAG